MATTTTKTFRGIAEFGESHFPLDVELTARSLSEAKGRLSAGSGRIIDLGNGPDGKIIALMNFGNEPCLVRGKITVEGRAPLKESVAILTGKVANIKLYDPDSGEQPPEPRPQPSVAVLPPAVDWSAATPADLAARNKRELEIRDKIAADAAATAPSRRRKAAVTAELPSPEGGWSR